MTAYITSVAKYLRMRTNLRQIGHSDSQKHFMLGCGVQMAYTKRKSQLL